MTLDSHDTDRASRIAAAAERESRRQDRVIYLYLCLMAIPIAVAVWFGVYGRTEREAIKSTVEETVVPIVENEVVTRVGHINEEVERLRGLPQEVKGLEVTTRDNSVTLTQLRTSATEQKDDLEKLSLQWRKLEEDVSTDVKQLKESGSSLSASIDEIKKSITQDPEADTTIQSIKTRLSTIEDELEASDSPTNEDLRAIQRDVELVLAENRKLRISSVNGDADLQILSGQRKPMRLRFDGVVNNDSFVTLKAVKEIVSFQYQGETSQFIRLRIPQRGTMTVYVQAPELGERTTEQISVRLGDQTEELNVQVMPKTPSVNADVAALRREVRELRAEITALDELRIESIGSVDVQVSAGQTATVLVKLNRPAPGRATVTLRSDNELVTFPQAGRPRNTITVPVSEDTATVQIRAGRVKESRTVRIRASLNGGQDKDFTVQITP